MAESRNKRRDLFPLPTRWEPKPPMQREDDESIDWAYNPRYCAEHDRMDCPSEELGIALKVIREFKDCESTSEWLAIQFAAWAKLEQLEEFLAHLVEGQPLEDDTIAYRRRNR